MGADPFCVRVCVCVCVCARACMLPQVWSQTTSNWVQARLLESSKGWCRVEHDGSGDEEWLPLASAKLRRPLLEGARDAAAVSARAAAAAAEKKKGKSKSKGAGESSGGGAGNGGEDREKEKGASGKKDGKKRKASQEDGEAGVGGSGAERGGGRDEKKRRKHEAVATEHSAGSGEPRGEGGAGPGARVEKKEIREGDRVLSVGEHGSERVAGIPKREERVIPKKSGYGSSSGLPAIPRKPKPS